MVALLIFGSLYACRYRVAFELIPQLDAERWGYPNWLLDYVRDGPQGVRLAAQDVDVFGGSNKGVSFWIVTTTRHRELARQLMEARWRDQGLSIGNRAGAAEALFIITGDTDYLLEMFRLAQVPGPPAVGVTRFRLARYGADPELARLLMVPHNEPIPMTEAEFVERALLPIREASASEAAGPTSRSVP